MKLMADLIDPEKDPRTVDELVNEALTEWDEDLAWDAISALQWRGSYEVLQRAKSLCHSICPDERRIGADILGQLGVPERSFPQECGKIVTEMLNTEEDADVLQAVLVAICHLGFTDAIEPAASFENHSHPSVRHAVVLALTGDERQFAIVCLIRLSADAEDEVRDWATFALGTQIDLDTPHIRNALAARLEDPDNDTRAEAVMGLARRKDQRAVSSLQKERASDSVDALFIEAAELVEAPELAPLLSSLRMGPK
jgi:HEAT repeat protein